MTLLLLWITLFEQIPEEPFIYAGNGPREKITFNGAEAPLFDHAFHTLLEKLPEGLQESHILEIVSRFVDDELFDREEPIDPLIHDGMEVPLETFLEKRGGICRHYALTTTLLIDRLIREGRLQGEVFLIRDRTPQGRHGWTLFLSEEGAWHIDPYWGLVKNGKEEKDFLGLCQKYGKRTMDEQKRRWVK